jgi:hypothetical protein
MRKLFLLCQGEANGGPDEHPPQLLRLEAPGPEPGAPHRLVSQVTKPNHSGDVLKGHVSEITTFF